MAQHEQTCWAFDVLPSQVRELEWSIAWYDVIYKVRSKLNFLATNHLQNYDTLVEIVGAIFGGKSKDKPINVDDLTPEAAVKGLNDLFAMAGQG